MSDLNLKALLDVAFEKDVAELRGVTVPTLRNERAKRKGPPYQKIGNRVVYPLKPLRAYLAASTVTPSKAPTLIDGSRSRRTRTA